MNRLVAASASVGWTKTLFSRHSTLNVGLPAATCTTGSPTSMTVRWLSAVFRWTMRVGHWFRFQSSAQQPGQIARPALRTSTQRVSWIVSSFLWYQMLYIQETPSEVSWTVVG